jgi:hypothetical protein
MTPASKRQQDVVLRVPSAPVAANWPGGEALRLEFDLPQVPQANPVRDGAQAGTQVFGFAPGAYGDSEREFSL